MFSSLPEDESLDDVKPQRIKLDSSIYEEPIEVEEFKDSVVSFDDTDVNLRQEDKRRGLQHTQQSPTDR